jgi:hypothetical protein
VDLCMEELGKALICLYYVCYVCWGPVCCGTTRCCSRTGTDAKSTSHTPSFLSAKPQRTHVTGRVYISLHTVLLSPCLMNFHK